MRIKSIKLKNIYSFKELNLDFSKNEPGLYVINGINHDDPGNGPSNGSGKSILVGESLYINLFGKSLRAANKRFKIDGIISFNEDDFIDEVEYFLDNEEVLKIVRSKKEGKSSKVEIFYNGADASKRTKSNNESDIRSFIDLDPELANNFVFYYSGNPTLTSMLPSQRLEYYKKFTKVDILDQYYISAKEFNITNNRYLEKINYEITSTKKIIEILNQDSDKYIDYIKTQIEDNKHKKEEYETSEYIKIDTSSYEKEIEELEEKIEEFETNINSEKVNRNEILSKNSLYDKELTKIKTLKSKPECPFCHQEVPENKLKETEKYYIDKIEENNKNKEKIELKIKEISSKISKVKSTINDIEEKIDTLKTENRNILSKIRMVEDNIKSLTKQLTKAEDENKNSSSTNISIHSKKLKALEKAKIKRLSWKSSIEEILELVSPKSTIRARILSDYINVISEYFEYYLSKLSGGSLLGKLTIDDSSNIEPELIKSGNPVSMMNLSLGQEKKVIFALFLAMYEFSYSQNPNIPKFIVLDEILTNIDSDGIVQALSTLAEFQQNLKIDIFLISHSTLPLENIKEELPIYFVKVSHKNGISKLDSIERL